LNQIINGLIPLHASSSSSSSSCSSRTAWSGPPIVLVPAGSSNGTSYSLHQRSPFDAVERFFSGTPQRVDLMQIKFYSNSVPIRSMYGILHLSLGLIGDHDYFQEHVLRNLDPTLKNVFAPILAFIWRRPYSARIRIRPTNSLQELLHLGYTDYRPLSEQSCIAEPRSNSNCACRLHKRGKWEKLEGNDGWYETSGNFILMTCMNVPYGAPDQFLAPHKKLHEGSFDFFLIREGISLVELLRIFYYIDQGKHVNRSDIEMYKLLELHLEVPSQRLSDDHLGTGMVSVDGELIPTSRLITVQSVPGGAQFVF